MLFQFLEKVKTWYAENKSDFFTAAIIFLVTVASFGLGRLSVLWPEKEPLRVIEPSEVGEPFAKPPTLGNTSASLIPKTYPGRYVVSKLGAYYHYPWCAGAQRIKEENKVWFNTKEEAEGRGYKPAGNCPGL